MKKTMILAAAAALFMLTSCQKEEINSSSSELTFTAAIVDGATKTSIDTDASSANKGKVSWEAEDEISISDGINTAVYYIKDASDIAGDGSASFSFKSGDALSADAESYTASYGDAITTAQTFSASAGKLPMSGVSDDSDKKKLNFTVSCGLLKLNLTALEGEYDKTIQKIEITGTPAGGSETTYTLTCSNESIESAKDFYIALPAGSYTRMTFTNSKSYQCFKSAKSAMTIESNKIQPVTLSGLVFDFVSGEFSVSATKKVRFTKGNLWWDGSSWNIEDNQISYPTSWNTSHVGHFFWSKTASVAYAATYSDGSASSSDTPFFAQSKGLTIDGISGLYAMTNDEMVYLTKTRENASSLYKKSVTVCSIGTCMVIAPDGYTGTIASSYSATAWAAAEAEGLVCLAAAGRRGGYPNYDTTKVEYSGNYTSYWLATPNSSSAGYSILTYTYGSYNTMGVQRKIGYPIRLVATIN